MVENTLTKMTEFFASHIWAILVIVVGAYIANYLLTTLIEKIIRRSIRRGKFKTANDEKQREDTLISTLKRSMRVVIMVMAVFMVLAEVGLDIGPLIAGAGVVGVALGFGAQSMVKDYLAGFFIIAENQYRVGDVLQVNRDVSGVVEQITLRVTVLRDLEGMVHHIANGNIEIATNMTMDYAQVDLNLGVGYDSDLDEVERVINQVGQKMAADEKWKDIITEAPAMARVNEFADSAIIVKILCKTIPMQQWDVKGDLLRRLKKAFDEADIEIPFPQRVLHNAEPKAPAKKPART